MTKKGRYDERDTLFARMAWREGSPAGEDYYKRNPEKKAIDNALRRMPDLGSPETPTWNPLASAVTDGAFRLLADWHPQVECCPNGPGLNLPPEDLSRWATGTALHFGADLAATVRMKPEHFTEGAVDWDVLERAENPENYARTVLASLKGRPFRKDSPHWLAADNRDKKAR